MKPARIHGPTRQEIQRFAQYDAAGARRWRRNHAIPAIIAFQRLAFDGAVADKIGRGKYPRSLLAGFDNQAGWLSAIEPVGSVLGDYAQHARQVLLDEPLASGIGPPVLEEDCAGRSVLSKISFSLSKKFGIALFEHETSSGKLDRRAK